MSRDDRMSRFISLDHLDRLLVADEWDRLGLRHLRALRLEVESEKQKIINEDRAREIREGVLGALDKLKEMPPNDFRHPFRSGTPNAD